MKAKEDRRVKYTKALLKDALVRLMSEKPISKISVAALCEEADVNRSTFYAHYNTPTDLLVQLQNEVLDNVRDYIETRRDVAAAPETDQRTISLLNYLADNRQMVMALLGDSGDSDFCTDVMQLVNLTAFEGRELADNVRDYAAVFAVSGGIAILRRWLQNGMPESTEEMARMVLSFAQYGVSRLQEP